jgi:hypothetical protein
MNFSRIERAGNLVADAAEGKLVGLDATLAVMMIVGWADKPTAATWEGRHFEHRQLLALAARLDEINRNAW